jgi:hypothetical protein
MKAKKHQVYNFIQLFSRIVLIMYKNLEFYTYFYIMLRKYNEKSNSVIIG